MIALEDLHQVPCRIGSYWGTRRFGIQAGEPIDSVVRQGNQSEASLATCSPFNRDMIGSVLVANCRCFRTLQDFPCRCEDAKLIQRFSCPKDLSPTSSCCNARTAFAPIPSPAPAKRTSCLLSNTFTSIPILRNAMAVPSPPMPAPIMIAFIVHSPLSIYVIKSGTVHDPPRINCLPSRSRTPAGTFQRSCTATRRSPPDAPNAASPESIHSR